jgi:hypothetical protein
MSKEESKESLDRPCLSSLVARVRMENNPTFILGTISSIVGVGEMRVSYIESIESMEEVLDRLEQVDECVQAGCHVLGRLVHADVIRIYSLKLENGTYSK